MPEIKVPADITVDDFFKKFVPEQFERQIGSADLSFMEGKDFTLQFNVDDKKFCIKVTDGKKIEVIGGGIDKPMITVGISEKLWRDSITGKVPGIQDQFAGGGGNQLADERRYNALQNTKGTLKLDLNMDDGSVIPLELIFNGESTPATKLMLAFSDWVDMQKGEADGQALFMQGKIKFEGDMMFLMSLQQFM